jgi:hypothetical protein
MQTMTSSPRCNEGEKQVSFKNLISSPKKGTLGTKRSLSLLEKIKASSAKKGRKSSMPEEMDDIPPLQEPLASQTIQHDLSEEPSMNEITKVTKALVQEVCLNYCFNKLQKKK